MSNLYAIELDQDLDIDLWGWRTFDRADKTILFNWILWWLVRNDGWSVPLIFYWFISRYRWVSCWGKWIDQLWWLCLPQSSV